MTTKNEGSTIKIFSAWYPVNEDKSYTSGQVPKHIEWIKDKTKLNVYPNEAMYEAKEYELNYGITLEPRVALTKLYKDLENGMYVRFKYIFTADKELLKLPNAKFMTLGGQWYGTYAGGGTLDINRTKTKNIAMLNSNKEELPMHKVRLEIAKELDQDNRVDCYGTFKDEYTLQNVALDDYRYSIQIEPDIEDNWFSERIENCFGAMTIPIYWGCPNIDKYFNIDGIIQVNSKEELYETIDKCNEEDYNKRKEAMKDNYERALKYKCYEDVLYEKYKEIIEGDYYD